MRPLDTAYMGDLVPIILGYVPLTLGMAIAAMAAAAASIGTRTGTENVVAMIDEALAR